MFEFDRFELGPVAHWWPGLGLSSCCNAVLEVLTAPTGEPMISRCGECRQVFYADEPAELTAS